MTLYELNQAGYASLPKMTKAELEKAKRNIITFLDSNNSRYYMMLNHDNKYSNIPYNRQERIEVQKEITEKWQIHKNEMK